MQDGCVMRASALTYTSLLALVPLTVVIFSALSMFPFFDEASKKLQGFVFSNFVPHTGEVVQKYISQFEHQASKLPLIGFAFLIITAILMLFTLEKTLNEVWKVQAKRGWRSSLLMYWAILTIGPILMGASVLLSSYLLSLNWIAGGVEFVGMAHLLMVLPFIFTVIGFTFVYIVVPNCPVRLWDALRGAVVAAVLFEVAKEVFSYYVTTFPTYKLLYGALATIPIFLLWVYLSWIIFLFGAEVVNGLRLKQSRRRERFPIIFLLAYRVLRHIWACQQTDQICSFEYLLNCESTCSVGRIRQVLEAMTEQDIIHCDESQVYLIKADLHALSLYGFIQRLKLYIPEVRSVDNQQEQRCLQKILKQYGQQAKTALGASLISCFKA